MVLAGAQPIGSQAVHHRDGDQVRGGFGHDLPKVWVGVGADAARETTDL